MDYQDSEVPTRSIIQALLSFDMAHGFSPYAQNRHKLLYNPGVAMCLPCAYPRAGDQTGTRICKRSHCLKSRPLAVSLSVQFQPSLPIISQKSLGWPFPCSQLLHILPRDKGPRVGYGRQPTRSCPNKARPDSILRKARHSEI